MKAHQLFLQAFKEPKTPPEQKKLARILKKPLTPELEKEIFEYEAFSRGLGRMSLSKSFPSQSVDIRLHFLPSDLEAHGGLYILHSHLNHSCSPNISVRHVDQRTALSRITMIAKRDIKVGEELLVSYVNPESGVKWRRTELEAWGFGTCQCARCVEEAKHLKEEPQNDKDGFEMKDLEKELKAGFGML